MRRTETIRLTPELLAYLQREAHKGGREDIEKAFHTLGIYLELTDPKLAQNSVLGAGISEAQKQVNAQNAAINSQKYGNQGGV